jgi:hypothetical protein
MYNTKVTAEKAARAMEERAIKKGEDKTYSYYKFIGLIKSKIST